MPEASEINALLSRPAVERTLGGDEKQALLDWLDGARRRPPDPVLTKVLAGVGAWFASLFIVAFLLVGMMINEQWGAIIGGLALMATSVPMLRKDNPFFVRQMALAFALAGNLLLVWGIALLGESSGRDELLRAFVAQFFITAVAWAFLDHAAYRFVAAVSVALFAIASSLENDFTGPLYIVLLAGLVAAALLYHPRLAPRFLPLAYAGVFSFLGIVAWLEFAQRSGWMIDNAAVVPQTPIAVMCWIAMGILLLRLEMLRQLRRRAAIAVALVAALLAWVFTPGVLAAVLLLVVAFSLADRVLGVAAAVFLPVFLYHHYHALNATLAQKSILLLVGGAILLVAFMYLGWIEKRSPGNPESEVTP